MTYVALALLFVMPALVIIAGLKDLTTMTIPNWISGLLILGFFPAGLAAGLSGMEILAHLGVAFAALLIGMAMFALRWLGGGDAKLMASACLWFGLSGAAPFILYTAVVGGLLSLGLLLARQHVAPWVPSGGPAWITTLMEPRGDLPYGVAIAAGALLAYPASPLVVSVLGG